MNTSLQKTGRSVAGLILALLVAGCAANETTSRAIGTPFDDLSAPRVASSGLANGTVAQPSYAVQKVVVTVPETLKVSEANLYLPIADIVWRGDPRGDRYQQVHKIVEDAALDATRGMNKGPAAIVEIQLTRFHALTEKARFTIGGTHAVHFNLTVRDAKTGAILEGPRKVRADIHAAGGARALEEEAQGLTQKVVISRHLTDVIRAELSHRVQMAPDALSALTLPASSAAL
ncbi:DUF6778 family protein [Phaeovulum sp. W22_SRMD_FR3]|uniref:DUF6778 family protein n=1 Tax=Phaeovulum sp. W22_SRMD_FR3 TaxID=3240274 RepID=UPI003F9D1F58